MWIKDVLCYLHKGEPEQFDSTVLLLSECYRFLKKVYSWCININCSILLVTFIILSNCFNVYYVYTHSYRILKGLRLLAQAVKFVHGCYALCHTPFATRVATRAHTPPRDHSRANTTQLETKKIL